MKIIEKKYDSIESYFLENMGKKNLKEVNDMFQKSYDDKYVIKDMGKAVSLINKHKTDLIYIFGDYDADGITATSILVLGLKHLGFNVKYLIPKRHTEGFGINIGMVNRAISNNAKLIITCDNGIAQVKAISYAKKKGLDVLITDHHQPLSSLPDADVIIDPNAIEGQCEFTGYCGAGIAYKTIKALIKTYPANSGNKILLDKCLSLAAIGTIADVMELKEENYVIVRNGLKKLQNPHSTTLPLYSLMRLLEINNISAESISFKLAPVINAQSRLRDDGAMDVVKFLIDEKRVYEAIKKDCDDFISSNNIRKDLGNRYFNIAEDYISKNCLYGDVPLVVNLEDCPEGLIGIIAGKLKEKYNVPAIVLTSSNEDEDIYKASGRSTDNYDMYFILKDADAISVHDIHRSVFIKYGGHKGACGFSILKKDFDYFSNLIHSLTPADFEPDVKEEIIYNFSIPASSMKRTATELERFEPWGNGNPMPIFKVTNFNVIPTSGKYITKFATTIKASGLYGDAIGFDMPDFPCDLKNANFIGEISNNYFRGNSTPQVRFSYFEEIASKKKTTPLASLLTKMANS